MKSFKAHSPVIQQTKTQLVPLKQKFSKTSVKEVPGWRLSGSVSPTVMKITPSKLSQVSNKRDFHSPLLFATDERLPLIFSPVNHKQPNLKRNLNKQTLVVPNMKTENMVNNHKVKNSKLKTDKKSPTSVLPALEKTSEDSTNLHKATPQKLNHQVANSSVFTNESPDMGSALKNQSFSPSLSTKFTLSDHFLKDSPSLSDQKVKSLESGRVLLRRKSDTMTRPRLRIQNKKMTAEAFKTLSRSKSFGSNSESEISETVSSESEENPAEDIKVLRSQLDPSAVESGQRFDLSKLSFRGRTRPSAYLVPGKDFDLSNSSKRSASFQQSSLSRSSQALYSDEEHEKGLTRNKPRKSATKEPSGYNLALLGNVRRSVTQRNYTNLTFRESRKTTVLTNDNMKNHGNHLQSSLSPSQSLRKSIGQTATKGFSTRTTRSSRILNHPIKPLEGPTDTQGGNSQARPLEKDHSKPGLKVQNMLRKSPTVNLDHEKQSQIFKLKKFKSEKQNKNLRNLKTGKMIEDSGTSDDKMMKMMIKITEAPDMEQNPYYQNNNYLVSMNPEKDFAEDDPHHLNILNTYSKHKGKKSDLPSRSRASSHEWTKDPYSNDMAKTKMTLKKNFRKTEANIQDMSKKYSLSPRQNKNDSDSDSDDIYSVYSNESAQSKRSTSRKVTEIRKSSKKPSNPPFRRSTLRNPTSIKFLKSFIVNEVQRKLGTLDPVTNFLYNFSFSILKCIQTLSRISLLRNNKKVQMKPVSKSSALGSIEKDFLHQDKLKVNKMKTRESRFFSGFLIPAPRRNSKSQKKSERLKNFKQSPTFKTKLKDQNRIGSDIEELEEVSSGTSSESSSSHDENEENLVTRTRKSILYELAKQELTLQIARQILEVKEDEEDPEKEVQDLDEDESEEDIEDELAFLSKKLKTSPSNFAFGPDINFKQMQKNLMFFSFKELEGGCYEIDMENLMRDSNKRKFLDKKVLENQLDSENKKDLQVAAEGNMTEEQMYRARIQKVRVIGKKLRKRREKLEGLNRIDKERNIKPVLKETQVDWNFQSFGETFEERVYFRLKGSASPAFLKALK